VFSKLGGIDFMNRLPKKAFNQIRRWVYQYARQFELVQWQHYFENGSKEAMVKALSFFQNEDGGFSGMDPDCSNPGSSPWNTVNEAYGYLVEWECAGKSSPIMQGIIRYVANTDHFTEHGWYWAVPSNNDYPCEDYMRFPNSPWFPDDWPPEKINNGELTDFVLTHFNKDDEVYKKTLRMIKYRLSIMHTYVDYCKYANGIEQGMEAWDWRKMIDCIHRHKIISGEEYEHIASDFLQIVERSPLKDEGILLATRDWRNNKNPNAPQQIDFDGLIKELSAGNKWNDGGLLGKNKKNTPMTVGEAWWPIISAIGKLRKLKEHDRIEI